MSRATRTAVYLLAVAATGSAEVRFQKSTLDTRYLSEGAAVVDVNRDGKLDIMAGNLWYEAPQWAPHEIAPVVELNPANRYSNSFFNFGPDVDGDGWPDQIVFGLPRKPAIWRRNPQGQPGPWKESPIAPEAWTESPSFVQLFPRRPNVLVFSTGAQEMVWMDALEPWNRHVISSETPIPDHGLGAGDIDGDGRPDVITIKGYFAAPDWKFVPADLGPDCAQMLVYDVNGDGLADVITSSAHNIGVWWFEQRRGAQGPGFIRHTIDDSFSQSHALAIADINGDGLMDIVTGKRRWAHGVNGDVRPGDPLVLYWFELRRTKGQVEWIRHEIDNDSGVGTQVTIADVNRDQLPDIVVSSKKGVHLFLQVRSK